MSIKILFSANDESWAQYRDTLVDAFDDAGLDVDLFRQTDSPETVEYVVYAPSGPVNDFTGYSSLKAILSLWAGVERIADNPTIKVPICRMVDEGLSEGMVEWVTGHILRHHLGMDVHIHGQDGVWLNDIVPPLARDRVVGFLGLGELGLACANAASALNFNVKGWSRSQKTLEGIECFFGADGLQKILSKSDILVLLLPDTAATADVLNEKTLALLPKGAVIINPGRGSLIDENALLTALDNGAIAHATLDVFKTEPLPPEHAFWANPNVTVTPHIASETRASSASRTIAMNIKRGEAGQDFMYTVDRKSGY